MSELSPAAQAVLTAYNQRALATKRTTAIAAALRAAADQVVPIRSRPDEPFAIPPVETMCWMREVKIRDAFLAIAAELEGHGEA